MAGSLYMLRDFFKTGRNAHGGYMGENEDILNATQRNLSLQTDDELLALRDSALLMVAQCELTHQERRIDDVDTSDAVQACPDCDRPNQFGEICPSCERDRNEEYEDAQREDDARW
ncbi:MAG: hypothetical protein AB7I50_00690 [Vicinamibacterales bacterium]